MSTIKRIFDHPVVDLWIDRVLKGYPRGDAEVLVAAGAIGLDESVTIIDTSSGSNIAMTLADGSENQSKTVLLRTKGGAGNAVITPANLWVGTTITLDAVGEHTTLRFIAGQWLVDGGIAST